MPKPVVAGVNGVAAGAGAGFAFAADYRVVADTAAFNTSFAGVALTADSGISWTLPRLVGPRPGRRPAALPAQRSRPQEALRAGHREPGGAGRRAAPPRPRRWPGRWPRGRRSPTRRSRSRWPTAPRTRWPRPWPRRTSCRRGPGASEDHAIAVRGVRGQGEAEVPRAAERSRERPGRGPRGRASAARAHAVRQVVVDQAAGLHQGVGRGGPDEAEAALLEGLGQRRRLRGDRRDVRRGSGAGRPRGRGRRTRSARPARPGAQPASTRALASVASILARLRMMPGVGEQPLAVGVGERGDRRRS